MARAWKIYIMNKWIFRAIILCILIVVMVTSCKLKFKEDDYYFIPAYRTEKLENGEIETSLHKRYFVQNYRFNKKQYEGAALDTVCQAINDRIPLSYLDFSFNAGRGRSSRPAASVRGTYTSEDPWKSSAPMRSEPDSTR